MKKTTTMLILFLLIFTTSVATALPTANFNFTISGINIHCTSTSTQTSTIDAYKWEITQDGVIIGSTGWITDTNNGSTYDYTVQDGGQYQIGLCVKNQSYTDCVIKTTEIIQENKDKLNPEDYNECTSCQQNGYYWYNNRCNREPQLMQGVEKKPLPEAGTHKQYSIRLGEYELNTGFILLIFFIALIGLGVKNKKKRE